MDREKILGEFVVSLTIGGILAIVLCMVLPEIQTKLDVFGFYFPFWFLGTAGTWSVIDLVDSVKERR